MFISYPFNRKVNTPNSIFRFNGVFRNVGLDSSINPTGYLNKLLNCTLYFTVKITLCEPKYTNKDQTWVNTS